MNEENLIKINPPADWSSHCGNMLIGEIILNSPQLLFLLFLILSLLMVFTRKSKRALKVFSILTILLAILNLFILWEMYSAIGSWVFWREPLCI